MPVTVKNLSVEIDRVPLLGGVSFELREGEVLAVIGPNGAGKSTLMKAMVDEVIYRGEITLSQQALHRMPLQERAKSIAVLPQYSYLRFDFTAEEVVAMSRVPHNTGLKVDRHIVQEALQKLDIEYLAKRPYTRLSGGEAQRVQLARVMAQVWRDQDSPHRILLLDEPTSALDISHQHQLMALIQQFAKQGAAVMIILHDFNLAARYADRMMALRCGQLVGIDSPSALLNTPLLADVFNVKASVIQHPIHQHPVVLVDE